MSNFVAITGETTSSAGAQKFEFTDSDGEEYIAFNEEYVKALHEQARAQNQERYDSVTNQYGAVQATINWETMAIESIDEPIEYLQETDGIELERWNSGDTGLSRASRPLTSTGLCRLAEGQLAKAKMQWESLRNDPTYFISRIKLHSENCFELLDPIVGKAPTPAELLSTPKFLASQLRYSAHNHLNAVAEWSLILGYLREIQELDKAVGRFGDREKRGRIMANVKILLDQRQDQDFQRFVGAVILGVPEVRNAHQMHQGAEGVQIVATFDQEIYQQKSLRGALYRVNHMWQTYKKASPTAPTYRSKEYIIYEDIGRHWDAATEAERMELVTPQVEDAWKQVVMLCDLIEMLSHDNEDWRNIQPDERIKNHYQSLQQSQKIFEKATIDKYTKSISSLGNENKWKKMWLEIDDVSKKLNKTRIEEVVASAVFKPSWTFLPSSSVRTKDLLGAQKPEKKVKKRVRPQKRDEEPPEERVHVEPQPPEVPIVPYTDQRPITPSEDEISNTAARKDKIKTRGKPGAVTEILEPAITPPSEETMVLHVGKKELETMEQLLVRVERTMDWADFEKAITQLGFSKTTRWGSRLAFWPPSRKDPPLFVDRPHKSEMSRNYVENLGKQLKALYGWEISMFSSG